MRQILPVPADIDPVTAYGTDARPAPPGRPWLLANMVASADGAAAIDGRTGDLGGAGDREAFTAIRGVADVIVAAAGTVRAERYRPPGPPSDAVAEGRRARGQAPRPRLAVVTRSMDLQPDHEIFGDPDQPPLVFTGAGADPDRRAAIETVAEVVELGDKSVDLAALLGWLADHGASVVLTEGGPSLLGQFIALDLLDELCLTVAPVLASGPEVRIAHSTYPGVASGLALDRVFEAEGSLLLRYRRAR